MVAAETNPGWAAGIAKRNPLKQLAWRLKGAEKLRKKDLRLSSMGAIVEARKLRDHVTALMTRAEAHPEDAMVFCVFAEPDLSALIPEVLYIPAKNTGLMDLALAAKHADKLPIGFLVFVLDRKDPQQPIFGHARPLIVEDPRGPALNAAALHSYERKIKDKLIASGEIPDDSN